MQRKALADMNLPKQHTSEDTRQYAYRVIKKYIISFTLLPGQKMNEQDFASALQTSRTPVHDSFSRLSREKLVDIIPQRGAFVSKLDLKRIEEALWTHSVLGINALHNIFIKNVRKTEMDILFQTLHKATDYLEQNLLSALSSTIYHYYSQLYQLAGDMNLIWDSLEMTDGDFQRLLTISVNDSDTAGRLLADITAITDALLARDCDTACQIYQKHLDRLSELAFSFSRSNPDYFTAETIICA